MRRHAKYPGTGVLMTAAALALMVAMVPLQRARATELIPSLGLSKLADAPDANTEMLGGLAVRAPLATWISGEIGAQYRSEARDDGLVHVRTWPITASLWFTPIPQLYAGGGVGWYQTTFDYDQDLPYNDSTQQDFGVHLGGGLKLPLAPKLGVDLQGRYVFRGELKSEFDQLDHLNPDYWSMTVGLALGL